MKCTVRASNSAENFARTTNSFNITKIIFVVVSQSATFHGQPRNMDHSLTSINDAFLNVIAHLATILTKMNRTVWHWTDMHTAFRIVMLARSLVEKMKFAVLLQLIVNALILYFLLIKTSMKEMIYCF